MKTFYKILTFLIVFATVNLLRAQVAGDYRSYKNGNWNAYNWEKHNSTGWVWLESIPTSSDGVITIQSRHTITITVNVTVNQVVVKAGAILTVNSAVL